MEYFFGSAITMIAMFLTTKMITLRVKNVKENPFRYSQSHIHMLLLPLVPNFKNYKKIRVSQSTKHADKINIKVIIYEKKAYFVKNGTFYCADMNEDQIDSANARLVDTMSMDKVQLDKMLFIMDQLRDGKKNDSGDTRNQ
jgi:hypothetical protein